MCLAANVVRFLAISVLGNPWLVLPFQCVQGMCSSKTFISISTYPPSPPQPCVTLIVRRHPRNRMGIGDIVHLVGGTGQSKEFSANDSTRAVSRHRQRCRLVDWRRDHCQYWHCTNVSNLRTHMLTRIGRIFWH